MIREIMENVNQFPKLPLALKNFGGKQNRQENTPYLVIELGYLFFQF